MYITPNILNLPTKFDDLADLLNNMPVSLQDFATLACMDGRAHGVKTFADTCSYELNDCVRRSLINRLIDANQAVVNYLGYWPILRYHVETIPFQQRFKLAWPLLDLLNLVRVLTPINSLSQVPVNYYLETNIALTTHSSYNTLAIPISYGDPNQLIFRHPTSFVRYFPQDRFGYPQRINDEWIIAFDTNVTHVSIQHPNLVYVDVSSTITNLVPVYYNTQLQIKPVKVEDVDNITRRYWFYVWQMLDPAFFDQGADLTKLELYKFVPFISFMQETFEPFSIKAIYNENLAAVNTTTDVKDVQKFKIVNDLLSLLEVDVVENRLNCTSTKPHYLQIAYVTNPSLYKNAIPHHDLVRAISHLVAAELPLSVCGCEIKDGFIATAQKPYTEIRINPVTGDMISNLKFGNLYGQLVYSEVLHRYLPIKRTVRL